MRFGLAAPGGFRCWLFLTLLCAPGARADDAQLVDVVAIANSDLERELLADLADGRLDAHTLLEAGLIASGVTDRGEMLRYLTDFEQKSAAFPQAGPAAAEAQAVAILRRMQPLLRAYEPHATELTLLIDEGRFNCASSTLLFNHLAAQAGLQATAIQSAGHVVSTAPDGSRTLEIETTCPDLDAAVRPAEPISAAGTVGEGRRVLSDVQLLAVIYYNRGVSQLEQKQFASAAALNRAALRLDPQNDLALGNLLAALNNWAVALCEAGDYPAAHRVLQEGRALAPEHPTFRANWERLHRLWVDSLCVQGQYSRARQLMEQATGADDAFAIAQLREIDRREAESTAAQAP